MEINSVPYECLLRIPGIGINSALKIVKARKYSTLKYTHLQKLGVVLKRAKYFITVNGEYHGLKKEDPLLIRNILVERERPAVYQMKLFDLNKQ